MRDAAPSKHGLIWSAGQLIAAVARRFVADRSVQTAGSLTFTTLLSLVPMITVALSMTTAFPVFDSAISALQDYLVKHFLPGTDGVEAIATQINAFTQRAGRLTAIGLGFLAITSLMLMLTIEESMNRVFRVQRRRPLAQRILMYWSVLTLGPVLIGASLSMTSFVWLYFIDNPHGARRLARHAGSRWTCAGIASAGAVPVHLRGARDDLHPGAVSSHRMAARGSGCRVRRHHVRIGQARLRLLHRPR